MLIIVSDVAVDLLMDALAVILRADLTNIDVDVLADVNAKVFAGVMTAFDFAMSGHPLEFRCWATFDCPPMTVLDCGRVLQTWMPSYHV